MSDSHPDDRRPDAAPPPPGSSPDAPGATGSAGPAGSGTTGSMGSPPPAGPSVEARRWATIMHLSALVGLLGNGIGFILGPLIVWMLKRDEDPYLDDQGKEAVNFQITWSIVAVVGIILAFVLIGIPLIVGAGLVMVVFPIIAAVKADQGKRYRYPLSFRFIK